MKKSFLILLLIKLIAICFSITNEEIPYYYKDYIKSLGKILEEHEVITEDGYKLTLWHLTPNSSVNKNKVVYFQHGFQCTSWVFFQLGKNSLPILLSNLGYDIWLGNSRGSLFSLDHVYLDSEQANGEYWEFSMDETVFYDLPSSIDYVIQTSGAKKVSYIGHSQGTTLFFMLYMHNPSYVETFIDKYISLGTVPSISYSDFLPIKFLDKVYGLLEMSMPLTKAISFSAGQRIILSNICKNSPKICKTSFEAAASLIPTNRIKYETLFPFLYYYPGGTSSYSILQWSQIHQAKKLVYFNPDYSETKEFKEYDINVIRNWKIKSFIQRSDCDTFSSYEDVTELYNTIEDKSIIKLVDTPNYGHTDDLAAESAIDDVYIPVIKFLE